MQVKRITKIAGLSVIGFCITAATADKINLNPAASQIAGFVGAMIGTVVGGLRRRSARPHASAESGVAEDHDQNKI